jgi:hypothetical protein
MHRNLFFFLLFLFSFNLSTAQEPEQKSKDLRERVTCLKTWDGNTICGEIINENDSLVIIRTNSLGTLTIPADQISNTSNMLARQTKKGEYWNENPGSHYYMIAPSAYPLGKGNFYYRNLYILINTVGYGITDYLTFHAGFDFYTLLNRRRYAPEEISMLLFPQLSFKIRENFRMGGGFIYAKFTSFSLDESLGAPFLNFAYGTEDRNVGLCLGYNVFDPQPNFARPVILLNGIYRVTNRIALEAEIYRWPQNEIRFYVVNYGVKFIARKMSVDLGFIKNSHLLNETALGIPFASFTVRM